MIHKSQADLFTTLTTKTMTTKNIKPQDNTV